jgi:hypothetical protein
MWNPCSDLCTSTQMKCYSEFVCRLGDEIESWKTKLRSSLYFFRLRSVTPERAVPCLERFRHYKKLWRNCSAGNDFPVSEALAGKDWPWQDQAASLCVRLGIQKTEECNSKAACMGGDNGGTSVLNVYYLMGLRDLNITSKWNDFLVVVPST